MLDGFQRGQKPEFLFELLRIYAKNELNEKEAYIATDVLQHIIIRNTDNKTFIAAMSGASGEICIRFLSNLSDRLLSVIDEDIRQYKGTTEEVRQAQQRMLNLQEK